MRVKAWALARLDKEVSLLSVWPALPADTVWSAARLRAWLAPTLEGLFNSIVAGFRLKVTKKAASNAVEDYLK